MAGRFQYRASVSVGGIIFSSAPAPLTVQFPNVTSLLTDPGLAGVFLQAWNDSKGDALERGIWIQLNTFSGALMTTGVRIGANDRVTVGPRPRDQVTEAGSGGGLYTVGQFHTHTPEIARGQCHTIAPSPADRRLATRYQVPFIIYDFQDNKHHRFCFGDSLDTPFAPLVTGPHSRPTP